MKRRVLFYAGVALGALAVALLFLSPANDALWLPFFAASLSLMAGRRRSGVESTKDISTQALIAVIVGAVVVGNLFLIPTDLRIRAQWIGFALAAVWTIVTVRELIRLHREGEERVA